VTLKQRSEAGEKESHDDSKRRVFQAEATVRALAWKQESAEFTQGLTISLVCLRKAKLIRSKFEKTEATFSRT
jgi:hypothetical protein